MKTHTLITHSDFCIYKGIFALRITHAIVDYLTLYHVMHLCRVSFLMIGSYRDRTCISAPSPVHV